MTQGAALLGLLLFAGCIPVGAKESTFARPRSEVATVDLGEGHEVVGEVLAVDREGLVLYTGAVVQARWDHIRSASFDRMGIDWREGARPDARTLESLRLVSRFPQGLDEAMTARLLDAYGQESIRPCQVTGGGLDCGRTR